MNTTLFKFASILLALWLLPAAALSSAEVNAERGRDTSLYDLGRRGGALIPDEIIEPAWEAPRGLDDWYVRLGASVGYYRMGPEIERALGQIEDFFSGKDVRLSAVNFDTTVTMTARGNIERAETSVLPMSELGFGYGQGRSRLEFSVGLAGMVKLNTINADTPMVIHEAVLPDINDCPMAKLGFVDPSTGNGTYRLRMVLNEEVWLLSPAVTYDYAWFASSWGMLTLGTSLSLVIITVKQEIRFKAERTDLSGAPYSERVLEGAVQSTAVNDMGPRLQVHAGYRQMMSGGYGIDVRFGVSAGFVNIHRDVDGASTIYMGGDALPISFPLTSVTVDGRPFQSRETNRIELMGVFLQAGISI
jgi:hypothetical protein